MEQWIKKSQESKVEETLIKLWSPVRQSKMTWLDLSIFDLRSIDHSTANHYGKITKTSPWQKWKREVQIPTVVLGEA